MYFIELILTRECNKSCYYCTTHSSNDYSKEVDIDFLKYSLDLLPDEIGVELTGGEIGLIKNIDEVYETIKNNPKIKHIIALSNGMLRKLDVDWLKEIEYWEHLIDVIKGREIVKFYDDLDLEQNHKYIIVTTKSTTSSLLANWSHFKRIGLFRPNFFYKLMNHKSRMSIQSYFDNLCLLYSRLENVYFQRMLIHYYATKKFRKDPYKNKKQLCQKYSPNPFIDIQKKQIGHCAINVNDSIKVKLNKSNMKKMINGDFSDDVNYCESCYTFDNGINRSMLNNRSYKQ